MDSPDHNTSFESWLLGLKSRVALPSLIMIFGWIVALSAASFSKSTNGAWHFTGDLAYGFDLFHAATCLVLALAVPKARTILPPSLGIQGGTEEEVSEGVSDIYEIRVSASHRILQLLSGVYFLWAAYYVCAALFKVSPTTLFSRVDLEVSGAYLQDSLSALNASVIFLLYVELAELTVFKRNISQEASASVFDAQRAQVNCVGLAVVVVFGLTVSAALHLELATIFFSTAVALLSGVALAMVAGRLASRFFGLGPLTLALLYLYAVIQAYAPAFDEKPAIAYVATSVALPLKIILWLVFVWAFSTGKMFEYISGMRALLGREGASVKDK